MQAYKINGEKAVHLNPRPQQKDAKSSKTKGGGTCCEACGRHIQDLPNRFCSIACKVSSSLSSIYLRACTYTYTYIDRLYNVGFCRRRRNHNKWKQHYRCYEWLERWANSEFGNRRKFIWKRIYFFNGVVWSHSSVVTEAEEDAAQEKEFAKEVSLVLNFFGSVCWTILLWDGSRFESLIIRYSIFVITNTNKIANTMLKYEFRFESSFISR